MFYFPLFSTSVKVIIVVFFLLVLPSSVQMAFNIHFFLIILFSLCSDSSTFFLFSSPLNHIVYNILFFSLVLMAMVIFISCLWLYLPFCPLYNYKQLFVNLLPTTTHHTVSFLSIEKQEEKKTKRT